MRVRRSVFPIDGLDECSTERPRLRNRVHLLALDQNWETCSVAWLEHEISPAGSVDGIHVYVKQEVEEILHIESTELANSRRTLKCEVMLTIIALKPSSGLD